MSEQAVGPWKIRLAPSIGYPSVDAPLLKESVGSVDPVDQIRHIRDLGFSGIEDTHLKRRPIRDQSRIGEELARTGLSIGAIVNSTESMRLPLLGAPGKEAREQLRGELLSSIEAAKRCGATFLTTVGARDLSVPLSFQLAWAVDNLRFLAEIAEKHSVVICLEHTNEARMPGMLLHRLGDTYLLVKAVDSPAVKLIADLLHIHMTEPSVLIGLERCWDAIATIQASDCPERSELGSGEMNYACLLKFLLERRYEGLIGLEHNLTTRGRASEQAYLSYLRKLNSEL
jgi:hydroxypyruvate isomerase